MRGYTSKTDIENYLLQTIDSSYDTQLESWITSVENTINALTGRIFIADNTASARVYDGDDTCDLLIDDCIEVTKVEVGVDDYGSEFQEIEATGPARYYTYPANAVALNIPISKIVLNGNAFPAGHQSCRITAKWGYSAAVPSDIKFVATVFVAGIINQLSQGGNEIKSESIGNYQVTYNSDNGNDSWADFERAKDILKSYTKILI